MSSSGPAADAARADVRELIAAKGHAVDNARAAVARIEAAVDAGDLVLTPDLKTLSEKLSGVSRGLLSGSYYLLPNLALFNVKGEAVHGVPITAGYMLTAIGYGLSYAAVVLLLSCFVFQRRDF